MTEISYGPPVPDDIEAWARRLVAARGDGAHFYGDNGLLVESHDLGLTPIAARENTSTAMMGSFYRVVRSIQLATYPDADFGSPFWDEPNRTWQTVMLQFGDNDRPVIKLPEPLTAPTLARVVTWRGWVPELCKEDIEVVTYTLFDLRPAFA